LLHPAGFRDRARRRPPPDGRQQRVGNGLRDASLPSDQGNRPSVRRCRGGGRIEALSPSTVLVSVGDHQHNGIDGPDLVRDPASSYGRIYAVDLETREARLVSQGHRNPQGLTVNDRGEIWATEHGPRGGDELNRIRAGGDYG